MSTSTFAVELAMTITDTPTLNDLRYWWETRRADADAALAFTDAAPQHFAALLGCIRNGSYLFYLAHSGEAVVGAMWLHDLVHNPDGTPRAGWLGTYVLPGHRGRHTTHTMWLLVHEALCERGVGSIYIASHHANTRAHVVAERHLGFHRVDIYPAFAYCQGRLTDYVVLSMRQEDRAEAWALARARAQMQQPAAAVAVPTCGNTDLTIGLSMVGA